MGNVQCCKNPQSNQKQKQIQFVDPDLETGFKLFQNVAAKVENNFLTNYNRKQGIKLFMGINVENLSQLYKFKEEILKDKIIQEKSIKFEKNLIKEQSQNEFELQLKMVKQQQNISEESVNNYRGSNYSQNTSTVNNQSKKTQKNQFQNDIEQVIEKTRNTMFKIQKNSRKSIQALPINKTKNQKNHIQQPYYLPWCSPLLGAIFIYVGQWKYQNCYLNINIPYGIGRLYFKDQIWEGQIQTSYQSLSVNKKELLKKKLMNPSILMKDKINRISKSFNIFLNGYGRQIKKQQVYCGNFIKNKLHGKGQYKHFARQQSYEGYWTHGIKNGKGIQKTKLTLYDGKFKNNKKQGEGVLIFYINPHQQKQRQKEEKYIDDNINNNPQFSKRKDRIKIQQKLNQITALLLRQTLSKEIKDYKGQQLFVFSKSVVIPKLWNDSTSSAEPFIQNLKFEQGVKHYFLQKYIGQFKNDLFDGKGSYQWANGNFYIGQWREGKMNGEGRFFWKQGYFYSGQYKEDLKHGRGQMIWDPYRRYRGNWAFGKKHGYGQEIRITKDIKGNIGVHIKSCLWKSNKQQKRFWQKFIELPQNFTLFKAILVNNMKYYMQINDDSKTQTQREKQINNLQSKANNLQSNNNNNQQQISIFNNFKQKIFSTTDQKRKQMESILQNLKQQTYQKPCIYCGQYIKKELEMKNFIFNNMNVNEVQNQLEQKQHKLTDPEICPDCELKLKDFKQKKQGELIAK